MGLRKGERSNLSAAMELLHLQALGLGFLLLLLSIYLLTPLSWRRGANGPTAPLPSGPMGWPVVGNLLQLGPRPHRTMTALAQRYGPLLHLRLGSSHVVVASTAAVAAEILRAHDANFLSRPLSSGAAIMAYGGRNISFIPHGPRWRLLRRIAAERLLSPKALDASRLPREAEAARLVDSLRSSSSAGEPVDVGRAVNACVANAMTSALVGRRLLAGDAADEFRGMVLELTRLAGAFVVGDFVPALRWLDAGGVKAEMRALAKRFDAFLDRVVQEGGGFMTALVNEGLSGDEVKGTLLDMFIAGTDTSSSTVEWALTELIRHPEELRAAQREVDAVVGLTRLVSEADLSSLPRIHAVAKEALRLHPTTPLSLPRVAAAGCEVAGRWVPPGATLLINIWAIGRDPDVWSDPLEFQPARFLPGGAHESVDLKGGDYQLIPFGAGRRICAGLNLGLRTVQLLAAILVQAFDWTLPMGQDPLTLDREERYGLTLQRAVPLVACPKPRLSPIAYQTII